jgi:shikimate dehydrogenase
LERALNFNRIQKLAVIGDPIAHSLSPKLQSFLIRHFALPFTYEALHIRRNELPEIMQRLRGGEFRGINVTIPHKQAVLSLLDKIHAPAAEIGAVNTIVANDGKLSGHNTDALGFLRNLEAAGIIIAGKNVFVLGAGGAARAVIFALLNARAGTIFLCNRSAEHAEVLKASFVNQHLQNIPWSDRIDWLKKNSAHLVINTTSMGMHPQSRESPLPAEVFSSRMVAIDIVYNPLQTAFLRAASSAGAKVINGLGMLIHQGVAAMELWSGKPLDIREIYLQLEKELIAALK